VRSRNPILGLTLEMMTLVSRLGGTEMNRDTLHTVRSAGFCIRRIESVFLDIILSVRAQNPVAGRQCRAASGGVSVPGPSGAENRGCRPAGHAGEVRNGRFL
jgi:hypothetical protein